MHTAACELFLLILQYFVSAKLPTGLYILLALISSFYNLRQIISGSTGPIFTIFHQMKGIYVNFLDPDLFFDSFWQPSLGKICKVTFIQHPGILKWS